MKRFVKSQCIVMAHLKFNQIVLMVFRLFSEQAKKTLFNDISQVILIDPTV